VRLALLALVLYLVLGGCTVLHDDLGEAIPWEASLFKEGETHYRDVLGELGCPLKVSRAGDGVAFVYEHIFIKEGQIGISYDGEKWGIRRVEFLEWFEFVVGRAAADREALVMVFDRDGILQTERFAAWNQKLGSGFSIQFFIDVGSVVDTSAVRSQVDPNNWGAMLLRPLPKTLNTYQSIDDGRFGLELRGTPTGAGQRTLEMRKDPGLLPLFRDE